MADILCAYCGKIITVKESPMNGYYYVHSNENCVMYAPKQVFCTRIWNFKGELIHALEMRAVVPVVSPPNLSLDN